LDIRYKVPEFEAPTVQADNTEDSQDDEEWLFEPPPPVVRSREHIPVSLGLDRAVTPEENELTESSLEGLKEVYETKVRPLESAYRYSELSRRHFGDAEIFAKPLIVLMGPYSGGKSTMINYLLGTEFTKNAFRAGMTLKNNYRFL
jgi:hypothetical protein